MSSQEYSLTKEHTFYRWKCDTCNNQKPEIHNICWNFRSTLYYTAQYNEYFTRHKQQFAFALV